MSDERLKNVRLITAFPSMMTNIVENGKKAVRYSLISRAGAFPFILTPRFASYCAADGFFCPAKVHFNLILLDFYLESFIKC